MGNTIYIYNTRSIYPRVGVRQLLQRVTSSFSAHEYATSSWPTLYLTPLSGDDVTLLSCSGSSSGAGFSAASSRLCAHACDSIKELKPTVRFVQSSNTNISNLQKM